MFLRLLYTPIQQTLNVVYNRNILNCNCQKSANISVFAFTKNKYDFLLILNRPPL